MSFFLKKYFSIWDILLYLLDTSILVLVPLLYLKFTNILGKQQSALIYIIFFVLFSQLVFFLNELYNTTKRISKKVLIIKCVLSFIIVYISFYTIYLFLGAPACFQCIFIPLVSCILIFYARILFYWILKKIDIAHRVLFLGTDDLTISVVRDICAVNHPKFKVIGFISDDPSLLGKSLVNPRVVGLIDDLNSIVEREKVGKVVVCYKQARGSFPVSELIKCRFRGVEILDIYTFYELLHGKILINGLRPSWLIFSEGFKKTKLLKFLKREIDIVASALGLLIALPILIITAILIKIESKGPIIYKQERVGENNKVYNLYKFRSMRVDAEKDTGPVWAEENDNRTTKVGKFIRKIRIDEIPQMINVLKGDMSFVGPRPERPYFVKMLSAKIPYYNERHSIKPGITGWAAINYGYGANFEDALEKLQYDIYYIKNISPLFDLYIILKTIKIVIGRIGSR